MTLVAFEYYGQAPSTTVLEWTQAREDRVSQTSQSYEYLLGISAAEGKDILTVGRQRLAVIQATDAKTGPIADEADYQSQAYDDDIPLPTETDNRLHCRLVSAGCLDTIATEHDARRDELDRLAVVKERYQTFLGFDEYATLTQPASPHFPPYRYIVVGNRLAVFEALDAAIHDGDASRAVSLLLENMTLSRKHLQLADDLTSKLIFVAVLSEQLEALSFVSTRYATSSIPPITQLDSAERSLRKPLQREFAFYSDVAMKLDGEPRFFSDELTLPSWLVALVFNPPAYLNAGARHLDETIRLSEGAAPAFAQHVIDSGRTKDDLLHLVDVGELWWRVLGTDYEEYVGRMFDLDAKIALLNHMTAPQAGEFRNPYRPEEVVQLESLEERVCVEGPLPDERHLRCLASSSLPGEVRVARGEH